MWMIFVNNPEDLGMIINRIDAENKRTFKK
jgi:hypothetical protein